MRQRRIARMTVIGLCCLVGASVGGCGSEHEGGNHSVPSGSAGSNGQDPPNNSPNNPPNNGTAGNGGASGTGSVGNAGTGSGAQTGVVPGGAAHVRLVLKEVH